MAFEHPSGVPNAFDRATANPSWGSVIVAEDRFAQGAELNEMQTILARRNRRVGNLTAKDGDRISGAEIIVMPLTTGSPPVPTVPATMSLYCQAGAVYAVGDVRPVAAASFLAVPSDGNVIVGVRLQSSVVTSETDATLLGLAAGTEGEGEPGAARLAETLVWALQGDLQAGEFYGVYLLIDGAVIDQAPPPALSGVIAQIAGYDRDANGNYIVDGCDVIALGKTGSSQVFTVAAGTANIQGFKRIRESSLRFLQAEAPDLETIAAEPHTFTGATGGSTVIPISRAPIDSVQAAIVVKRVTETVTRGSVAGGSDALGNASVVAIQSVIQGGTTFATSAYALAGDAVSWAPAGAEPATSSTYQVTYDYNASVTPSAVTATTVTVAGGVNGSTALISYKSKLPRIDILCLDIFGKPIYVNGVSARKGAIAPQSPSTLLKLAEIANDWLNVPVVSNNGTHNYNYDTQRRYFERLVTVLDQFSRSDLGRRILEFEPVSKQGIFTDTFVDDFYRDQGAAQTAAANQGVLQLAIDNALMQLVNNAAITLDFVEEIAVSQPQRTSTSVINPYQNFTVMPGGMRLTPPVDFWTETQTVWTSPVTQEFTAAPDQPPGQTVLDEVTEIHQVAAVNLRQLTIAVRLQGFGAGENLATLTMDGVDVKPAGTQTADGNGEINLSFVIPANMPVGRRTVFATGAAKSYAEAVYVGQGIIDVDTMRRVTLVTRAAPVPVVVTVNTIINITQQVAPVINPVVQPVPGIDFSNQEFGDSFHSVFATDPLGQVFSLPEPRHVVGLNFWLAAIGNPANGLRLQLANVEDGLPGSQVIAECFIPMTGRSVGEKIQARFDLPVFLTNTSQFCFVILTSDATHAVSISKLGDVDPVTQARVSSAPYVTGPLCKSANRISWVAMPEAALAFEIVCAKFTAFAKTVILWTGAITNISDALVRGAIEIPTDAASFRYEIVRATGEVIALAQGQNHEFSEFLSETVTLRAVLAGSATISPVVYRGTLLVGGRIRTAGTYVTRLFPMGTAVRIAALFASLLPAGSNVSVDVDAGDNAWQALTANGSTQLGGAWSELRWQKSSFTAAQGRIRLSLAGGPGARPSLALMRAYSV